MNYVDPTKLRAYFFGNLYLSDIQHGIQAAHVVTKMFAKYGRVHEGDDLEAADTLYEWADDGVTKILLQGGYQSNLAVVYEIFEHLGGFLGLPFQRFYEEVDALNGALTSVGIVVPEEIYLKEDTYNWLDKDYGLFADVERHNGGVVSETPTNPTPKEILASLAFIQKPTTHDQNILYIDMMQTLLRATLRTARLV